LDQLDVLRSEGFDCEAFLYKEQWPDRYKKSLFVNKNDRYMLKPGYINGDTVRLKSDSQFFTFRDKIRWLFKLPPKDKVPQIVLFPNGVELPTDQDVYYELLDTNSVATKMFPRSNVDRYIHPTPEAIEIKNRKQEIILEEAGKHKSYKKFYKRVNKRMREEGLITPSIYDMMVEEEKRKKKKKKHKDEDFDFDSYYYESWDDSDKKKKKKKKKKDKKKKKEKKEKKKDKKKKKKEKEQSVTTWDGIEIPGKYIKAAKKVMAHDLEVVRKGILDFGVYWGD
jgi:hypothetical protein